MSVTTEQRQLIREMAGNCCEFCRVAQDDRLSKFQIDHIIPIKHGGSDDTNNLCLACLKCNSFKGPNVAALDPETGAATKLYNPRSSNGTIISKSIGMEHSLASALKDERRLLFCESMRKAA